MSEIGVRFPVVRCSDISLGSNFLQSNWCFRFFGIATVLFAIFVPPRSLAEQVGAMGENLFGSKALTHKGETFKSYLIRLLPRESVNRRKIETYARDLGIRWAPESIVRTNTDSYSVQWQLGFPDSEDQNKGYEDRSKIVDLNSGEFLVNDKPFHIRPLSGVLRDLELIEGLLTPARSSLIGDVWLSRDQRQEPWPREKGSVHLLTLMYGLYFSQPQARCATAKMALAHAMIGADAELHEIPRCDTSGIEVVIKENRMGSWLRLLWKEGSEETMAAEEVRSDGRKGRKIQYEFNSLGLSRMSVSHPDGNREVFSTEFGSPSLVSPQMLLEFRRRYVLIERVRNSGADWGFTCNSGCQKDIVAALADRPIKKVAKKRGKKLRPRRLPASKSK